MKKLAILLGLLPGLASSLVKAQAPAVRPAPLPATVIVPASDFLQEMPKGNLLADAGTLHAPWVYNNTALVLNSKTNMQVRVQVPEAGTYTLYVRSQGEKNASFRVAVNEQVTEASFGHGPLGWQAGGTFALPAGPAYVKLTRIEATGAAVDVLVLSKNAGLREDDIRPYQLPADVELLHQYTVPNTNAVKFGDVNGDGQTDFLVLEPDFSAHLFDHSGRELWSYQAPTEYTKERAEFEAPGVLWDFDHDGRAEVVHWRFAQGQEWLVMADGRTGKVRRQVPWPTQPLPHAYNNFRLAIAKLHPGAPNDLVVYTDMGGTVNVNAYTATLKPLWQHTEHRKKDSLGHYIYPVDLNGDGLDEVLLGSLLLNTQGHEIWNRFTQLPDNHDHADSYKFIDMNGDGRLDIATANSETGVFVLNALTGHVLWQNTAEHSQQLAVGNFLRGVPGPQVVVGGRTYGNRQIGEPYLSSQLYWFDNVGNLVKKWPGNPLNGNPDFVRGNWLGDGSTALFWYKFWLNGQGTGELYFPDPVFHMFDFTGRGAEEVITLNQGRLSVYGSRRATHSGRDAKKDPEYLRSTVVNHTHY